MVFVRDGAVHTDEHEYQSFTNGVSIKYKYVVFVFFRKNGLPSRNTRSYSEVQIDAIRMLTIGKADGREPMGIIFLLDMPVLQ